MTPFTPAQPPTPDDARPGTPLRTILLAIVFLPVLVTFLYVRTFSVELPWMDDWDIAIPQLPHLAAESLRWSDVNVQHNENVILFPQLVHLAVAKAGGYRVLAVIYISYLFLCGSLIVLFLLFRMLRLPGRWSWLWFLPVSVFFMGWRQAEGLLWSSHLANTMALFFSLLALYLCICASRSASFFAGAAMCACIASFSMGSGVLIFAIGFLYLAVLSRPEPPKFRLPYVLGWSLLGGTCAAGVIFDRAPHTVSWLDGIAFGLANLRMAREYSLIYLGSPFSANPPAAEIAGAVLVIVAAVSLCLSIQKSFRQDGASAGVLLVALVAVALVPLVAYRLPLGLEQANESRYVTLGSLAPIGVYFCILDLLRKTTTARYLLAVMAALFVWGAVGSYSWGLMYGRESRRYCTACAATVRDYHNRSPEELECAYRDPEEIFDRIVFLERQRLSLFTQATSK